VDDQFLYIGQTEFSYTFGNGSSLAFAPMILATTGGQNDGTAGKQEGAGLPTNENAQAYYHNFLALMLPAEFKFKTGDFKHKMYATYGINFEGGNRISDTASAVNGYDQPGQSDQNQLFNVGYELGKGKGKGAWKLGSEYRYVEAAAYDANLSDSDFAKNELNQHGIVITSNYSFTDNVSGGVTYMKSWDLDDGLDTSASDNHTVDLVQIDLMWKF
jgi:hypothetical protein